MDDISTILNDHHLPVNLKATRLNGKVRNYSVFADKLIAPTNNMPEMSTLPNVAAENLEDVNVFKSLPKCDSMESY